MVKRTIDSAIMESIRKYSEKISKHYKIESIILFGSYAKEEADNNSDIDLIIDTQQKLKGFALLKLICNIQERLQKEVDGFEKSSVIENSKIYEEIEKNISIEQVKEVFFTCKKIGIKTLAHYIIGLPQDNHESILKLIYWAKKLDSDFASFNIAIPLPDTEIEKKSNNCLNNKQLLKLRRQAYRSFYFNVQYIFKTLQSVDSISDFYQLIRNCIGLLKYNC